MSLTSLSYHMYLVERERWFKFSRDDLSLDLCNDFQNKGVSMCFYPYKQREFFLKNQLTN